MFYSVEPSVKKRRVHNKSAALYTLPMELLMEIALFLEAPSKDILNFMLVCKNFYNVMEHDINFNIWGKFYYRDFPKEAKKTVEIYRKNKDDSDSKFPWKVAFKDIYYLRSKFKVFCGDCYTIFLIRQGDGKRQLFGCGNNNDGQLGLGYAEAITKLCQLKGFPKNSKILNVFCGGYHTIFLIEQDGKRQLFGCGNNIFGQLGLGKKYIITKLCRLKGFPKNSKILNVFCGANHTIFLIEQDGKRQLFGCGNNNCGQLGFGDAETVTELRQLECFPEGSKILNVFCGGYHTIFLIEQDGKGQLFGCGSNRFGQFGLGGRENRIKFCQLKDSIFNKEIHPLHLSSERTGFDNQLVPNSEMVKVWFQF